MKTNKNKHRSSIWLEMSILIAIIICKILIMNYDQNTRMEGYLTMYDDGTLLIIHADKVVDKFTDLDRPVIEFKPDACRMIEVFDEDFNVTSRMIFTDLSQFYHGIENHPDIKSEFMSKEEGNSTLEADEDIGIKFKWVDLPDGSRYLLTFYYSESNMRYFSVINVTCYTSIFLTFMLFLVLLIRQYNLTIGHYATLTKEVRSKMTQ